MSLSQATSSSSEGAIADALSRFSSPLVWLIVVSALMSRGPKKTGLGSRIGLFFIALLGKKTLGMATAGLMRTGAGALHAEHHGAPQRDDAGLPDRGRAPGAGRLHGPVCAHDDGDLQHHGVPDALRHRHLLVFATVGIAWWKLLGYR